MAKVKRGIVHYGNLYTAIYFIHRQVTLGQIRYIKMTSIKFFGIKMKSLQKLN